MSSIVNRVREKYSKLIMLSRPILTSWIDFLMFVSNEKLAKGNSRQSSVDHSKAVIFICDFPRLEIFRIAKWVHKLHQLDIFLVCPNGTVPKEFPKQGFKEILVFRNRWHLKTILKKLNHVGLIHGFGRTSFALRIAIENYPDKVMICSLKDVSVSYYGVDPPYWYLKKDIVDEKFCINNSDGIMGESLEIQNAFRKYNLTKKVPTIFFPPYCDDDLYCSKQKQLKENDIHLVYVGGVVGSYKNKGHYGTIQFHKLIDILSEQGIHLHVYPNFNVRKVDMMEYSAIARKNQFFHFNEPVSPIELPQEISKYHFGIVPFFSVDSSFSLDKRKSSLSLKIFNFIEAGLPIIISKDVEFQKWIVKRTNGAIPVSKTDLPILQQLLTSLNYDDMVTHLIRSRNRLSLKDNIPRLVEFYEKVYQHKMRTRGTLERLH